MISQVQNSNSTRPRRVALFPGAFRPPHAAHLTAVQALAADPDIDEIVIIIASRCRNIPGTTLALDANVARTIWSIYLEELNQVRVEIAPHTAVHHAISFFDRMSPGDTLLFCIGETDLENGDSRFNKLARLSERSGIHARTIAAPTGAINIRATSLRQALVQGAAGRSRFLSALPAQLSQSQRNRVWELCRAGLQDMNTLLETRVCRLIEHHQLGEIKSVSTAAGNKLDPVFRVQLQNDRCLFVKYAGDTVGAGCLGQPLQHKPRRRLATERRTLRRLKKFVPEGITLPEIVLFDKSRWSLVLSEACPGSRSLQTAFAAGEFDAGVAAKLGRFLAHCHSLPDTLEPVWGDKDSDRRHWQAMLALRTTQLPANRYPPSVYSDLESLAASSQAASLRRLFLLDLKPGNIYTRQKEVAVTDLELGSTRGDPACDLGLLVGHYLLWGLTTNASQRCYRAIQALLRAHQQRAASCWPAISGRVSAFAGAGILHSLSVNPATLASFEQALINTAGCLLSSRQEDADCLSASLRQSISLFEKFQRRETA